MPEYADLQLSYVQQIFGDLLSSRSRTWTGRKNPFPVRQSKMLSILNLQNKSQTGLESVSSVQRTESLCGTKVSSG